MNPTVLILLAFLVAQASPLVTVSVDRAWYSPGEQVAILVHIEASADMNSTYFWLYLDGPDGRNILFTELYALNETALLITYSIPANATEGMYTVTVTWDHQYAQTGFMVQAQPIPEFPSVSILVLTFAAAATFLTIPGRKTGARS